MRRPINITCITFGVLIILISVILVSLQLTVKSTNGIPGTKGGEGKPEEDIITTQTIILLNTVNFVTPGGFTLFQNPRSKITTASFILTAVQTISLLPTDAIAIFQLPTAFVPTFATGAIGTIVNTLDVTQNHILLYDQSKTPNTSFLVRSAFTLQPSDRFLVTLMFVA